MPNELQSILLAEDNPGDVYLVREALAKHGVAVKLHVVKDGEAAIEFIEAAEQSESSECPQLALLDLNLPKRSGLEVLARLRRSAKCGNIPVTIISSSRRPASSEDAPQADRFFTKPSSYDAYMLLGGIVRDLLQLRQSQNP